MNDADLISELRLKIQQLNLSLYQAQRTGLRVDLEIETDHYVMLPNLPVVQLRDVSRSVLR